ncbi:MAG: YutD family protein [Culicoidibacterales bacterium]
MITLGEYQYELIENFRDAFNEEQVITKYCDVLEKYEYITGDIIEGYLRLKGFYADENPKARELNRISFLETYLVDQCQFGCAHFVLKKVAKGVSEDV